MLSEPFARVLAAGRGRFNERAAQMKTRYPAFDFAALGRFLHTGVDPVVAAVAAVAPERLQAVAEVAYEIALELIGRVLAGPAAPVWRELAPRYALLVARDPRETLGLLSNAVIHLQSIAGARPSQWVAEMIAIAPDVASLAQLQAVGQVLAWRAGAAHFRDGAIAAADQLPEALAMAAFGANGARSWADLREGLLQDPWWRKPGDAHGATAREVGAFTGLGGQFPVPPEARACAGGFLIRSGERHFLLVADAYGAVLHAATAQEFEDAAHGALAPGCTIAGAALTVKGRRIEFDLPARGLTACCNEATVAVTSHYTHAISLLALT